MGESSTTPLVGAFVDTFPKQKFEIWHAHVKSRSADRHGGMETSGRQSCRKMLRTTTFSLGERQVKIPYWMNMG